jgi:hypothetical protein
MPLATLSLLSATHAPRTRATVAASSARSIARVSIPSASFSHRAVAAAAASSKPAVAAADRRRRRLGVPPARSLVRRRERRRERAVLAQRALLQLGVARAHALERRQRLGERGERGGRRDSGFLPRVGNEQAP